MNASKEIGMKRQLSLLLMACVLALPAAAAEWPTKPVTMIVPFPPGGSTDVLARMLAQNLSQKLGQQVVVENRAGAAGNLGTSLVVKAAPDGHTLSMSTSGPLANAKFLYKNLPYDPLTDLTPVAAIGEIPMGIAVSASSKLGSIKDLIDAARAQPGKLSIAHPGTGTIGHLTAELIKAQSNVTAISVPHKGDIAAMTDLMGGVVDVISIPITALIPQIKAGKIRALAVTSRQRLDSLPQVPTAQEQGINEAATVWMAVVGPKGLPDSVVSRLNRDINAFIATPEARSKLSEYGAVPLGGSAQQLADFMVSDSAKWKRIIEGAKVTLD
jgi:tripartite-type tricarboxylate transporter receptor subunit TctC